MIKMLKIALAAGAVAFGANTLAQAGDHKVVDEMKSLFPAVPVVVGMAQRGAQARR